MGLPFGFALAVLFCVCRWSSDREILALRSHGLSISQWSVPIFLVGFLLSILSLYAGVEWAPVNRAKFDELKKGDHLDKFKFDIREVGQITFPLNSNSADSSFEDLTSLATENPQKYPYQSLQLIWKMGKREICSDRFEWQNNFGSSCR